MPSSNSVTLGSAILTPFLWVLYTFWQNKSHFVLRNLFSAPQPFSSASCLPQEKTQLEESLAGCSSNHQPRGYDLETHIREVLGADVKHKPLQGGAWEMHSGVCWRIQNGAGSCSYKQEFLLLLLAPNRTEKFHLSLVCIIMNKLMPQAAPEKWFGCQKCDIGRPGIFKKFNAQIFIWANPARWLNKFELHALNSSAVSASAGHILQSSFVHGRRCSGKCYPPRE